MNEALVESGTSLQWKRGLAWLLFLGPFFFLSYGYSNHLAARHAVTESIVFGWEHNIPFVPWTIVPYWSIDLFYGLSFLLCRTAMQVDRHALRLLSAQLISVSCFILFPLHFTFKRPVADGWFGMMFDALMGFDLPYNQAPSLHISLLLILWNRFAAAVRGPLQWFVHFWAMLIGVSVLTTYQHHFIDVPTGLIAGGICMWLWPETGKPLLAHWALTISSQRKTLSIFYLLSALVCAMTAASFAGAALWLFWPAVGLFVVSLAYAGLDIHAFQKERGSFSIASSLLLMPYLAGAWLNSRWWTRRHPAPNEIAEGVWLGRLPTQGEMRAAGFAALLDLTAELPAPRGNWQYAALPWLDLVVPDPHQLMTAASKIEELRRAGPLLVCCALGYSRSACAVSAWLLATGRATTVNQAVEQIAVHRPNVVLGEEHKRALEQCRHLLNENAGSHDRGM